MLNSGGTGYHDVGGCNRRLFHPHRFLNKDNERLLILLVLFNPVAWSTTYYVATTGADSNPGTSAAPFLTIEKGAQVVAAGDTVSIQDGTYNVSCSSTSNNAVDLVTAGTALAPITFKAAHYHQAILQTANTCAYNIKTHIGADYNVVDGLVLYSGLTGGIQHQCNYCTVIRTEVGFIGNIVDTSTSTAHVGIITYSGARNATLNSLYVHDIGRTNMGCPTTTCLAHDQLLYLEGINLTVVNNILRLATVGAGGFGMAVKVGSNYFALSNNTLIGGVNNGEHGQIVIGDDLEEGVSNLTIENNIFYNPNGTGGVVTCGVVITGVNSVDHNLAFGSGVTGAIEEICSGSTGADTITNSNNLIGDPLFINPTAFNYHIPFISPAVNAGVIVPAALLDYDGLTRPHSTAYDIGAYEHPATSPTVNTPLIDYVTYLGGSNGESVAGIAVDSTGSAYVAGSTSSPDFPLTSTSLGTPTASTGCSFVTKFNPSGTAIDFSVCLANSVASAFALDSRGNMYLAVQRLANPFFVSFAVVKLDPTAQSILYTTAIGGSVESMAVDAAGDIYVAGAAGPGLTTTPGAYQSRYAGGHCSGPNPISTTQCSNAFITKLTPTGNVVWTTYLGGSGPDDAHAIAIDGAGNVWVAGETVSPNFPTTAGAISRSFHGELDEGPLRFGDAFIAKLDPTGSHLLYSTYLGGSGADGAFGLAIDATGAVYVAGATQSTNFPTTPGAFKTAYSGNNANQPPSLLGDGFVTKLDASGNLLYSTFTGLMNGAHTPIAVDDKGQAYVSAVSDASSSLIQSTCATPKPAVLAIDSTGSALVATSPVPGTYLALDSRGGLYSAGLAYTLVFFSTPHAFQIEYGGGDSDAFAAKVDFSKPAGPALASVLNAASLLPGYATPFPTGSVAPGEIVTLFGNGFGSAKPSVNFSQYAATVLYASNCQINAVVPFEVTPTLPTLVTVQAAGQTLGPFKLPVVVAVPGIFTTNDSGSGQAAILNQDSTLNSPSNPAARGSIVSVYMTGVGSLNPFITDGSLGPLMPPFPVPLASVSATIGSVDALVTFVGQAPGLIAGATQVNVQVPQNTRVGAATPITIYAAGYASQLAQSITMAVH